MSSSPKSEHLFITCNDTGTGKKKEDVDGLVNKLLRSSSDEAQKRVSNRYKFDYASFCLFSSHFAEIHTQMESRTGTATETHSYCWPTAAWNAATPHKPERSCSKGPCKTNHKIFKYSHLAWKSKKRHLGMAGCSFPLQSSKNNTWNRLCCMENTVIL